VTHCWRAPRGSSLPPIMMGLLFAAPCPTQLSLGQKLPGIEWDEDAKQRIASEISLFSFVCNLLTSLRLSEGSVRKCLPRSSPSDAARKRGPRTQTTMLPGFFLSNKKAKAREAATTGTRAPPQIRRANLRRCDVWQKLRRSVYLDSGIPPSRERFSLQPASPPRRRARQLPDTLRRLPDA
jgi:hypothetical protein